jgi:hypothetical protein
MKKGHKGSQSCKPGNGGKNSGLNLFSSGKYGSHELYSRNRIIYNEYAPHQLLVLEASTRWRYGCSESTRDRRFIHSRLNSLTLDGTKQTSPSWTCGQSCSVIHLDDIRR